MKFKLYLFLLLPVLFSACHSSKDAADVKKRDAPSFNKNECFVRARVLETAIDSTVEEDPCSNYPCLARVKIVKVIRCGKIISGKPSEGTEQWVKFRYTLSTETNELFPDLQYDLPGLKKGQLFDAIWEFRPAMEGEISYPVIYDYRKI